MYRVLLVLALLQSTLAITEPSLEDLLDEIFGEPPSTDTTGEQVDDSSKCDRLVGRGAGCHECNFCNSTRPGSSGYRTNGMTITLNNRQCTQNVKMCCESQRDLLIVRSTDTCGKPNPAGIPRSRRKAVRAVLQAEFPWRAWVYSKNSDKPLCAATFIHDSTDKLALLTLASCVHGRSPATLEVSFTKADARLPVKNVIEHDSYRSGSNSNNVAVLQLYSLESPTWALPACLPCSPPPVITHCITTSSEDLRIDSVIPQRSQCTINNSTLPEDLTCAFARPGDYEPETAAGLYCLEQYTTPPVYQLQGIFAALKKDIGTYINVHHFMPWLKEKVGIEC